MTTSKSRSVKPTSPSAGQRWSHARAAVSHRTLATEAPIALVYNGSTAAVMMATPHDLGDFAVGFALTEGIVNSASDISDMAVIPGRLGFEVRCWMDTASERRLRSRLRRLVGPTGCGLCGVESLRAARRSIAPLPGGGSIDPDVVRLALSAMEAAQVLNRETRSLHAAGLYCPDSGVFIGREDVGRHNALDKLAGALACADVPVRSGVIVLSSRVSIEMVQKALAIGAPVLVAVSAPTALAVETAERGNLTLIAVARGSDFEVFAHAERIGANGRSGRRPEDATGTSVQAAS